VYRWKSNSETNFDKMGSREALKGMDDSILAGSRADSLLSFVSDVDIIGFYFSTSWCSPCKKFTSRLRDFYNMLRKRENSNSSMEIVFMPVEPVRYDLDEFLSEMPWLAAEHQNSLNAYLLKANSLQVSGDDIALTDFLAAKCKVFIADVNPFKIVFIQDQVHAVNLKAEKRLHIMYED
jgi:thiol-disulfide isomerase/thioredoxin